MHEAVELGRGARRELAVRERARAALAEDAVRSRDERARAPERHEVARALRDARPLLEHDRPRARERERVRREEAGGARADDDGPAGRARGRGAAPRGRVRRERLDEPRVESAAAARRGRERARELALGGRAAAQLAAHVVHELDCLAAVDRAAHEVDARRLEARLARGRVPPQHVADRRLERPRSLERHRDAVEEDGHRAAAGDAHKSSSAL